ncbi:MAG: protein kinase domain-containing protein [Gemmatimonadaceae bacterium]
MTDLRSRLQQSLGSTYTLERELGGGGMSRVFVAEENALGRKVVVKVLPEEISAGVNVERFQREIQLAARLQHPHIVQVLAAGQADGIPYYTMPFVEGESVRGRLARMGPFSITEAIGVLRDVARALSYAHERNVVHRDIKPDNVLLSGGSATVADFGIAKAISAARTDAGVATLTQMGTSIGTPAYMAPEQAAADPSADHRADIYSFGCLGYELLTGRPPFIAKSPQKLLAAHMGESPEPITNLRPDTPQALAELIMRCLAKEADARPQNASAIVQVLDTVTSGGGYSAMPAIMLGGRGMLRKALLLYAAAFVVVPLIAKAAIIVIGLPEWVFAGAIAVMLLGLPVILFTAYVHHATRRMLTSTPVITSGGTTAVAQGTMATIAMKASPHVSWRRTALGGAYALGGFIFLIGGYMLLRSLGIGPVGSLMAAGALDRNERILVADFTPPSSDTTLGPVITEAFRTALGQSEAVTVLQQTAMRDVLRRMQRPPGTRVDFALAREIATREGIKAVVDGNVLSLGGKYVISLRLLSPQSGETLASFRETAEGESEILGTIDDLAKQLRGKIGESLKSVRGAPPLEQVTTPSLEALKKYVQGANAASVEGDWARGEALLREAISLDTGFAMAYRKLAIEHRNRGNIVAGDALLQKAFEHRDRLSDAERYLLLGSYYQSGPHQDLAKSVAAYEQLLELQPTNTAAMNNLANNYRFQRQNEKAHALYKRAIATGPLAAVFYNNLIETSVRLGRFEEARDAAEEYREKFPSNANAHSTSAELLVAAGKYDSAARVAGAALRSHGSQPETRAMLLYPTMLAARMQGRLVEAEHLGRELTELDRALNGEAARLTGALSEAQVESAIRGNRARMIQRADEALRRTPLASLPINNRPLDWLVYTYSHGGLPARARTYFTEWEASRRQFQRLSDRVNRHSMLGMIALAEKRFPEAIRELRDADREGGCDWCALLPLADAYEESGNTDSTIALLTRYVEMRRIGKNDSDSFDLAPAHERLGRLFEARGDRARASAHYSKFIELWRSADPELQPRVQAAKQRITRLGAGRTG